MGGGVPPVEASSLNLGKLPPAPAGPCFQCLATQMLCDEGCVRDGRTLSHKHEGDVCTLGPHMRAVQFPVNFPVFDQKRNILRKLVIKNDRFTFVPWLKTVPPADELV